MNGIKERRGGGWETPFSPLSPLSKKQKQKQNPCLSVLLPPPPPPFCDGALFGNALYVFRRAQGCGGGSGDGGGDMDHGCKDKRQHRCADKTQKLHHDTLGGRHPDPGLRVVHDVLSWNLGFCVTATATTLPSSPNWPLSTAIWREERREGRREGDALLWKYLFFLSSSSEEEPRGQMPFFTIFPLLSFCLVAAAERECLLE